MSFFFLLFLSYHSRSLQLFFSSIPLVYSSMLIRALLPFLALAATTLAATFHKGHDLSSVAMMETGQGAIWHAASGTESTIESILASGGMTTVRLRLWVSSTGQYNLASTLSLAKRFAAAGSDILLDFHFSDTWADPSHQAIPAGWPTDLSSLSMTLRSYVADTLTAFHSAGVDLALVALGNEITAGMLWPAGEISNNDFSGVATLWAAARNGVRDAVSAGVTAPQVMIHLDNGWNSATQSWWYKGVFGTGKVSVAGDGGLVLPVLRHRCHARESAVQFE